MAGKPTPKPLPKPVPKPMPMRAPAAPQGLRIKPEMNPGRDYGKPQPAPMPPSPFGIPGMM